MRKLYEPYPTRVDIDGRSYGIVTDFRDWIKFSDMLKEKALTDEEKALIALNYYTEEPPQDIIAALVGLCAFYTNHAFDEMMRPFFPPKGTRPIEDAHREPTFDYEFDAECIMAGFYATYKIDLSTIHYLHWHQFKAMLDFLPASTEFKQRISYRSMNPASIKNAAERSRVMKIQREIAIPKPPPTDEEIGGVFW
jgi:hypothetical protein